MFKSLKGFLVLILFMGLALPAPAAEGMWMPHQMKDLDLKAPGLQMNPEDLYRKDGTGLMSMGFQAIWITGRLTTPFKV